MKNKFAALLTFLAGTLLAATTASAQGGWELRCTSDRGRTLLQARAIPEEHRVYIPETPPGLLQESRTAAHRGRKIGLRAYRGTMHTPPQRVTSRSEETIDTGHYYNLAFHGKLNGRGGISQERHKKFAYLLLRNQTDAGLNPPASAKGMYVRSASALITGSSFNISPAEGAALISAAEKSGIAVTCRHVFRVVRKRS